ncbi:MAG: amidohydrolase family protein [Victivallaceae bacterium]|nr:amidohydrolase family protein [Victivallaceae bacterium]
MKKIDIHHHLVEEHNYIDNLLRTMDEHEIEKSSLIGLGSLFKGLFVQNGHNGSCADDDAVEKVVKQYPDRFFGQGYIRLGVDNAAKVDELHDRGFAGLKFHIPKERYDAEEYFAIYEKAQRYDMPCLFHTGIVAFPTPMPAERISSFNMEPIHLEAVAQLFPELKIIIAHLGIQSYLTALTLIRLFPNIYADLSGSTPGWRANLSMDDWQRLLWFPNAHEKILFGSDVHWNEITENIDIYDTIATAAGWNESMRQNIYYKNSRKLFNFAK